MLLLWLGTSAFIQAHISVALSGTVSSTSSMTGATVTDTGTLTGATVSSTSTMTGAYVT